jgi:soluble lytic murein transglycosylase-like protein
VNPYKLRALLLPALVGLVTLAVVPARAAPSPQPDAQRVATWRQQARALEHGEGVERNIDAAISTYCKAAMAGDALASYDLGWIYANGRGVERNDAFAAYMFQIAADQGDGPAQRMLQSVGTQRSKPPCVLEAEAAEVRRLAKAKADAEAARLQAEREALDRRYQSLIDSAERRKIFSIVARLAPEYGIHPALAVALIRAESNFNPAAVSDKNAQGLMQLIPETAARFSVKKPFDPEQNIRGGMSYLRWLLAYFQGDVELAVAAYNAGEGTVDKYGGVPPYPETLGYVRRIREVYSLPSHPFDAGVTGPSLAVNRRTP